MKNDSVFRSVIQGWGVAALLIGLFMLYGGQYLYSIVQADGLGIWKRIHYGHFPVEQKQSWQGQHQLFDDL